MTTRVCAYHPEILVGDETTYAISGSLDDYYTNDEILSGIDPNSKSVRDIVEFMRNKPAGVIEFQNHGILKLTRSIKESQYNMRHLIR